MSKNIWKLCIASLLGGEHRIAPAGWFNFRPFTQVFLVLASLVLAGCGGSDSSGSAPQAPEPAVTLGAESFTADRQSMVEGEETTLRWNVADGTDVSISPNIGAVSASGERTVAPASTTEYTLTAVVMGQRVEGTLTIAVRPFATVQLVANATTGNAPLTVRLTPVVDSATAINRYFWDFEGDGGPEDGGLGVDANGFDRLSFGARSYDVTGRDLTFTYDRPGTYNPRVRVWDDAGNQAESTLQIEVGNAPPTAFLRATPTSGQAPLDVTLNATASDNEGAIASYEWDFNGDGVYDETTESNQVRHTYETPGQFKIGVRLTDAEGAVAELSPIHMEVNASAVPIPNVSLRTNLRSPQGTAPLEVNFTASASDPARTGITSWEWDLDGDGVVDLTDESRVSFTFDKVGNFYPRVRVTNAEGAVGTDILNIKVNADHSLVIENGSLNPEQAEQSNIAVSLKGTTNVNLQIEDQSGIAVSTLWPMQERPTGDYSVTWDGRSDDGTVLVPGDYYAVLRFVDNDGVESVVDYRASTGGKIFYPSGWGGSCRGTDSGVDCGLLAVSENELEPFNNNPTVFSFTNPNNARMTAYMTVIGSEDFAPASFFRSRLMPPGDYSVSWFGEGTTGKMLDRLERGGYLPAIFGLTASDNAIFLSHQTSLGALTAEPAIVYPAGAINNSKSTMTFDLSRQADVELTVDSVDTGVEVLRRTFPNIAAGANRSIEWDGRGNNGEFVSPGGYRLSVIARDNFGQSTLPSRAMQRIDY